MKQPDWLIFQKKVKFGDCDSAEVIHFHNLFRWAHEYWEESLDLYGISYQEIFPNNSSQKGFMIPIVSSEGKFFSPIRHGDILEIRLLPKILNNHLFQVITSFFNKNIKMAETKIIHCSIDTSSRQKVNIPEKLELWIEASNFTDSVQEC